MGTRLRGFGAASSRCRSACHSVLLYFGPSSLRWYDTLDRSPFLLPFHRVGHGAFEEKKIDVANRALCEIVEELSLSAVRAKIAAIEQALAFGFDEEGVGIRGGVVDEIGSDGELTDGKRLAVQIPQRSHSNEWLGGIQGGPGTKTKTKGVMSIIFQHAMRYGWATSNPIRLVRQSGLPVKEEIVLKPIEIAALLTELRDPFRTLILLVAVTGLRAENCLVSSGRTSTLWRQRYELSAQSLTR